MATADTPAAVYYNAAGLTQGISFIPATDEFIFEGDYQALNWTLSARWQPCLEHAFGAVYRSSTDFMLQGHAETRPFLPGREAARLDFLTPATAGVGYAWRPNDDWSFEVNLE
jgi:long-subunit fatty acid transport protein